MSHTPFVGNWRTLGSLSKYMLLVVGQHDMYLHEDFRKRMVRMVISLFPTLCWDWICAAVKNRADTK